MKYQHEDMVKITELLMGAGNVKVPYACRINEELVYETENHVIMDSYVYYFDHLNYEDYLYYLCQLCDNDCFTKFMNFYLTTYLDQKVDKFTDADQLRDALLTELNKIWSISNEEFVIENGYLSLHYVDFKLHDKLYEREDVCVYKCTEDESKVHVVLKDCKKEDPSAVYEFKKQYEFLKAHSDSGYTVKAYEYDPKTESYTADRVSFSLKRYLKKRAYSEKEKDAMVLRCAQCFCYLYKFGILYPYDRADILDITSTGELVIDLVKLSDAKNGKVDLNKSNQLLAYVIDEIMAQKNNEITHKYEKVIRSAFHTDTEPAYKNPVEMYEDIVNIVNKTVYKTSEELAEDFCKQYKENKGTDVIEFMDALDEDNDGNLLAFLVFQLASRISDVFIHYHEIDEERCYQKLENFKKILQERVYTEREYRNAAYWVYGIFSKRKYVNDDFSAEVFKIIEEIETKIDISKLKKKIYLSR